MRQLLWFILLTLLVIPLKGQDLLSPDDDPIIVNRLKEWQRLKFGFMMHWGIYAQWGVVESWSICNEPWIDRGGEPYTDYKSRYQSLNTTFNPTAFDATAWAEAAYDAGMRYAVFTTKHHDGFCLFDTQHTTYSSTDPSCPFSANHNADITNAVVEAFRDKGMWTGLYFSKADWHCSDYWAPEWATPDRNVNYNPQDHPDRWQRFCDFTFGQIQELTHNYGDIDILWLDGGWIRPENTVNEEYRSWLGCQGWIQDIDMPRIAAMARGNNPDLIIVDRTVHGKYENYRTPEQQVPDTILPYPWETCMSMGDSWSYVENDNYKSTRQLIHILVDVVAKGGNYLLNVGPDAQGRLPEEALDRMKEIGLWMRINGDAIYNTTPAPPYSDDLIRFTQNEDKTINAIILSDDSDNFKGVYHFKYDGDDLETGEKTIRGSDVKALLKKTAEGFSLTIDEDVTLPYAISCQL